MDNGQLTIGLPVWIDCKTTSRKSQRFSLEEANIFEEDCWVTINP